MKKVMGGMLPSIGCWTTDQCNCGEKCSYTDLGEFGDCVAVAQGSGCLTDWDCGNSQTCIKFAALING